MQGSYIRLGGLQLGVASHPGLSIGVRSGGEMRKIRLHGEEEAIDH